MSRCKLRTVYSEAPFEDKREPDADCEQSERCLTDPEPDMEMRQAHFRNMRSKCRCSCVLQFTRHHGVSSVLHRPPSQMIHCIVLCLNILRLASRVGIPLWGEGHTEKLARLHFPTWGEITNPGRGECSLNRFGICLSHDSHIGERGHGTSRQYRAIPTYDG